MTVREQYNRMIEVIEANAGKSDVSASDLARQAARMNGLSPRDMTSVMRYLTGQTLLEYVKDRKLMAAYLYLISDEKPSILHAVEIAGMDNQSSFTKRFSGTFGMPPREAARRRDRSFLTGPMSWERLSTDADGNRSGVEAVREPVGETIFGIPRDTYRKVIRASELEQIYGLKPLFSRIAFRTAERVIAHLGLKSDEEIDAEMDTSFRYLESIQESCLPDRQPGEPEPTAEEMEELEKEVLDLAESELCQTLFRKSGLSVSSTLYIMQDRIMPPVEELLQMDPRIIRAYCDMLNVYSFNFFFFKKAYEYYKNYADDTYTEEDYEAYLDYLDQNFCIETAFELVTNDFEHWSRGLTTDELFSDPVPYFYEYEVDITDREAAEEERWHNVILDLDLDEENAYYDLEDLLDPGPLDF